MDIAGRLLEYGVVHMRSVARVWLKTVQVSAWKCYLKRRTCLGPVSPIVAARRRGQTDEANK